MHTRQSVSILRVLAGLAVVTLCSAGPVTGQIRSAGERPLALIGATIHVSPAESPILEGFVLIRADTILAVGPGRPPLLPANAEVIDCRGMTITAGFWNSHVHFFERKWADVAAIPAAELGRQLQDMVTRYGFTSVFDIGSSWENTRRLRDRIESGEVPGPRIRSTGEALAAAGAIPSAQVMNLLGFMTFPSPGIRDSAQVVSEARKLLDAGADGIKLHLQVPPARNARFPESAIAAVAAEVRSSGKPVFLHPTNGEDLRVALRAGVDIIAHTTPQSGPWDATILDLLRGRGTALTPTLALWKSLMRHDRASMQDRLTEAAVAQLRAWLAAGGAVLFGTDLGAADYDPSTEYSLMADAGMSFRRILASLTTLPAERFGGSRHRGRLAAGLAADLVVLSRDPAADITALTAVEYTIRSGRVIYRRGQ